MKEEKDNLCDRCDEAKIQDKEAKMGEQKTEEEGVGEKVTSLEKDIKLLQNKKVKLELELEQKQKELKKVLEEAVVQAGGGGRPSPSGRHIKFLVDSIDKKAASLEC